MYSKDIESVLIEHSKLYPLINKEDLLKLIFQFTLGPNHLFISKLDKVKENIFIEAKNNQSTNKDIVYIGNDLYRVPLKNDPQYLNIVFDYFIKTCKLYENSNDYDLLKNNISNTIYEIFLGIKMNLI